LEERIDEVAIGWSINNYLKEEMLGLIIKTTDIEEGNAGNTVSDWCFGSTAEKCNISTRGSHQKSLLCCIFSSLIFAMSAISIKLYLLLPSNLESKKGETRYITVDYWPYQGQTQN